MQYTLKKQLGQHFLKDEQLCQQIVAATKTAMQEHQLQQLVEVGPGAGAITKYLHRLEGINFKAIDLDAEKVAYLQHTYPVLNDKLIHESILDTAPPFEGAFAVVGNFPYNISSQILFRMLDWRNQVPTIVGMFQKEVAQRVAASAGSKVYGVISVLLQAYFDITYLFDVPPQAFNPPPKVMSGVIVLHRKTAIPNFYSDKAFNTLVKMAFNQRRKTLRNATRSLFAPEVLAQPIFEKRAEQLTVADFADLTHHMLLAKANK